MFYRFVSSVIIPLFLATSFIGCGSTRPAASVATPSNLMITTTSMPSGTVGSSYSFALNAQGGVSPYSWGIASGSLPAGLQLNAVTGLVAGSPSAASSQTIGFSVQDSAQHSASAKLTLSIAAGTNGSTASSLNITSTSPSRSHRRLSVQFCPGRSGRHSALHVEPCFRHAAAGIAP